MYVMGRLSEICSSSDDLFGSDENYTISEKWYSSCVAEYVHSIELEANHYCMCDAT